MRWLRTISGWGATKARQAVDAAFSLVPNVFAHVAWALSSTYPELARKAFGVNAVVYSCLRLLCQSVAEPPLIASTETTDGELVPLPKTHPLAMLIRRPNELMTEFEMLELIELHTSLSGGSWWWKQRNNAGQIINLWPLRPDRIVPAYEPNLNAPEGQRVLRGWAYYPPGGGTPVVLPRSEVLAFGNPDPAGETGGIVETIGWVQVLATEVAADNEATSFVGALLANYAQPSLLLKTKTPIRDKEIAKRLKSQFMSEFGGNHRGEPALLDSDAEVEKLSFDLHQLEFPSLRDVSESRISAAAGTPAILVGLKVGLDASTYSNFESAREFFTETTLASRWRRYSDQFTNDLAVEYGDNIVCRFDTSQVKALAGQRQRHAQPIKEAFTSGVVLLDEYREKVLSLPPLPNGQGQVLYVPNNVKVVKPEELLDKPEPPALPPPPPQNALPPGLAEDDTEEDLPPTVGAEKALKLLGREPETFFEAAYGIPDTDEDIELRRTTGRSAILAFKALADDVQDRADKTRDKHADDLTGKVLDILTAQQKRAAGNVSASSTADDLISESDPDLVKLLGEHWELVLGDATVDAGKTLGISLSFDLENEWVQSELDGIADRVKGIGQTTRDYIKAIISKAAADGLSVPQVADLIRSSGAFSEARATTISRTETAVAYNRGAVRAYEESGLVDEVEVLDGDYDAVCQGLNGQRKSLEWARSNPIQHPNCRRALSPVIREDVP